MSPFISDPSDQPTEKVLHTGLTAVEQSSRTRDGQSAEIRDAVNLLIKRESIRYEKRTQVNITS